MPRKAPRCFTNVERWNGWEWEFVELLQPRLSPLNQLLLFDIEPGESLIIQITWETRYSIDCIRLHPHLTEVTPSTFLLASAIHSDSTDVLSVLYEQDANYVSILPDEHIDLEFAADGGPPAGMVRDFFFVTNGYFKEYVPDLTPPISYLLHPLEICVLDTEDIVFALTDPYPTDAGTTGYSVDRVDVSELVLTVANVN
ncbi:hypothetical protein DRQ36_08180, partial [bacterium]